MTEDTSVVSDPVSLNPLSEEALSTLQQSLPAQDQTGSSEVVTMSERFLKLHEAHNRLHQLHNGTDERLNQFERRLKKVESSASIGSAKSSSLAKSSGSRRSSVSGRSSISELSNLEDDYELGYEENTIPEVRDTNFDQFKNRYGDKDGKHCIEVLVAGSNFDEQVRQELGHRGELEEDDHKRRVNYDDNDDPIIQRVRIQSPALLWLLCKTLDESSPNSEWKGQNRTTFYRPFSWFVYVQDKMKEELRKLEDHWSSTSTYLTNETQKETVEETIGRLKQLHPEEVTNETTSVSKEPDATSSSTTDVDQTVKHTSLAKRTERELLQKALLENYHTLLELRCYTEFVEKRILPPSRCYEDPCKPGAQTIRYQDLWYLFKPGDLIVTFPPAKPQVGGLSKSEPRVEQCLRRDIPSATSTAGWTQPAYLACRSRKSENTFHTFDIYCAILNFDGEEYGIVGRYVTIEFFEGFREVTSLPVYPLRFHKESDELLKSSCTNGSRFRDAIDSRHMAYRGWSKPWFSPPPPRHAGIPGQPGPPGPPGGMRPPDTAPIMRGSAYLESDVVVDVKEALRASSESMIIFTGQDVIPTPDIRACQDTIEIIRWSDKKRTEQVAVVQDRTQAADAVCHLEATRFLETHPFAKSQKKPTFTPEYLSILPDHIFAYALRERKFFRADVRYLRHLQAGTDAFDSLKINPDNVRLVQAAVASHFRRKEMDDRPEFIDIMDQDLIRGKGRGLVILLHGAPGVGKTATAEAVALRFECPLFVITCGDLGYTPQGVESSLNEIFRLAHLWNCILLLDEADVFLSQRENNALQRNALVSVFLRVLEYYNGILFLTTNRVGTLDEAFKSRVHLSLYYPPLDRVQTEEIIRMNLVRLRSIEQQRATITGQKPLVIRMENICKFATKHWDKHAAKDGEGRWNGRQIRNAVQIAASLAWYDTKTTKDPGTEDLPPILDEPHFQTVEETMTLFERYMTSTKGGTDKVISEQRAERSDGFNHPGYNSREAIQPQVTGPTQMGSAGGERGLSGYHPYTDRTSTPQQPGRPQQQMSNNVAGLSESHGSGSYYTGSPGEARYQSMAYNHHQASTSFSGQVMPAHLTPSPSFSSMHTDQHNHMSSSGGVGQQAHFQNQLPQMGPQTSYMPSGMVSTPERQQGIDHQAADSAPRSSQPAANDVFGPFGTNPSSKNHGESNVSHSQPYFHQKGDWNVPQERFGHGM